ncbi:MAG: hypothetical protein DHS20C06_08250 [Hyphobacterium sp.]|nr:MAG: hypothetical protein DHS20C06_08250 [Hyphobacterium sp.]
MRVLNLLSALAVFAVSGNALAQDDACEGVVSADPARLYDFKHGDWDIHWRNRAGNGNFFEFDASGHVYTLMDGDVLIDEQTSDYFKGITFRTYNPATEAWVVRWLPANSVFEHPISAQLENCVPVERHSQLAPDGREVDVITRFENITENGFVFRQDWSFDAGETWVDDVLFYEAVRRPVSR